MDDRNAFEHRIANELDRMAGPGRQVDALSMARSAATAPAGGRWGSITRRVRGDGASVAGKGVFSMSSAARLITAVAVVALFGGALVVGILTSAEDRPGDYRATSPGAPKTTDELLADSVVEEMAPGVFHLLNDGVRDLEGGGGWGPDGGVTIGADGAVWLYDRDGSYFQVGEEASGNLMVPADRDGWDISDGWGGRGFDADTLHAGPSGQLWAMAGDGIRVWDTGEWVAPEGALHRVEAMGVDGDNVAWTERPGSIWRMSADGVTRVDWKDEFIVGLKPGSLRVAPEGTIYFVKGSLAPVKEYPDAAVRDTLSVLRDGEWSMIPLPSRLSNSLVGDVMDVGADGSVWVAADSGSAEDTRHRTLARWDGDGWALFGEAAGVGPWGGRPGFGYWGMLRVAPDGSAWVDATKLEEDMTAISGHRVACDGVARFDGMTWSRHLSGACIHDIDFAPDGTAWVLASVEGFRERVFVIRPDAPVETAARVS